jgi:prophage regulatory protein
MELPIEGYVRVHHIVGCSKRGIPAVIPVSRATWWAGVKSGRYPKGILLSPGVRVWNVKDIRALMEVAA